MTHMTRTTIETKMDEVSKMDRMTMTTIALLRRSLRPLVAALAFALAAAAPLAARADIPREPPPPSSEWESVNAAMLQPGETIPASSLVATAYGFIWLMVCGFLYLAWRRADRIEGEIEELRRKIAAHGK
jgi:hypothetical protein